MSVAKEAIAHVSCQVCELAVTEAKAYAKENAIVDEDGIADLVDGLCSLKNKQGRWVSQIDIFRETADGRLQIEKQPGPGECKTECLTVQRACTQSLNGKEETLA